MKGIKEEKAGDKVPANKAKMLGIKQSKSAPLRPTVRTEINKSAFTIEPVII